MHASIVEHAVHCIQCLMASLRSAIIICKTWNKVSIVVQRVILVNPSTMREGGLAAGVEIELILAVQKRCSF